MEIVLNFLLNYITLAVAGIAFVIILVVLFAKRKSLSRSTKLIFTVLLIILAVYFSFIIPSMTPNPLPSLPSPCSGGPCGLPRNSRYPFYWITEEGFYGI